MNLFLTKQQLQGLNHSVSAAMALSKPSDPIEVLLAIQDAYELLNSIQDAKPMSDSMLLIGEM